MSREKSNFKISKENIPYNNSAKRSKMTENTNNSQLSFGENDDDNSNLSVTIYEDERNLNYFNKSLTRPQLASITYNKRSPLAMINRTNYQVPGTSSSSNLVQPQIQQKILEKIDSVETPDERPNYFNHISDEILLHIFSYLPKKALNRIAMVNYRFSRVSKDESLWVRLDLGGKYVRAGAIGDVISRGIEILRLSQAKIQAPIFDDSWISTEEFQSKLAYLDLSMTTLEPHFLAQLLSTCRKLKKLSLEATEVDDAVCLQISKNKNLEVLNLSMAEGLTKAGVEYLVTQLKCLFALNISWTHLDLESVTILVENLTAMMLRLNIAGCRNSLLDKHIKILSEKCPNVVELDISDCSMLTAKCIPYIKNFDSIEYLSLSRCYNIAVTSYLTLNSIKSLQFIDVFGLLTDAGVKHMEKGFKNIGINKFIHSSVARPTVTPRRTSLWGLRTRD